MRKFLVYTRPSISNGGLSISINYHLFCYRYERHVYAYGAYPTPSKDNVGLLCKSASILDWVNKYENNIRYHAAWRVYLYFLLLVAYHNQQRIILLDSTELQHGVGVAPHVQACHSSLFPHLIDYSIQNDAKNLQLTSIIDKSFLNDWNNMTVACPEISNRFDTFLEGRGSGSVLRKHLLFILNACSLGKYAPHVALKFFFIYMGIAFKETRGFVKKFHTIDTRRAAKQVIFLQEQGMFALASSVCYSPDMEVIGRVLQWNRSSETLAFAYKRTQKILLTGDKKEAEVFLQRFKF